jgi:hypothetical protein
VWPICRRERFAAHAEFVYWTLPQRAAIATLRQVAQIGSTGSAGYFN